MRIPYLDLKSDNAPFSEGLHTDLDAFLEDNRYILGPATEAFEDAYARYCGTRHCVSVSSGFTALFLMMKALGISAGDEVIVPAHTCDATWLAVTATGAHPIPCDADPQTQNIDASLLPSLLTSETKAILVVHMNGNPCAMEDIQSFCRQKSLYLLEDNAQATGAEYQGRKTGSLGLAAAHSFYPTKNLGGLMDSGAITTDDPDLATRLRLLRNYGRGEDRQAQLPGYNLRPSEWNNRFLMRKLAQMAEIEAHRRSLAQVYEDAFRNHAQILLQQTEPGAMHARHLFTVLLENRDEIQMKLTGQGIGTSIHYPVPVHRMPVYEGGYSAQPIAERIARQTLSLPMGNRMPLEWAHETAQAVIGHLKSPS